MELTNWKDYKQTLLTEEEREELELKTDIISAIIKTRNKKKISQRDLESLSGVRQPIIARIEKGDTDPRLSTLIRIARPLELKLTVTNSKK